MRLHIKNMWFATVALWMIVRQQLESLGFTMLNMWH